jgi:hypothetical protein
MCVYSAVSDYYTRTWPERHPEKPMPFAPFGTADDETKRLLREALERLDKIDKRLGDVECHDEAKEKFKKMVGL